MESEVVLNIAPKLGILVDSVVRKAEELLRLAEVRAGYSSLAGLNLSGSCRAVMCLELAALACGHHVDRNTAIRVSGMPKKLYTNAIKVMESLLDLQAKVTVADLAVQFGCPGAKSLAARILKSYEDNQAGRDHLDMSQSLFNTAALYTACRKLKTKVDKNKMVDAAGVKKSTFDRLIAQMETLADKIMQTQDQDTSWKSTKYFLDDVDTVEEMQSSQVHKDSGTDAEEPFSEWKHRILTQAYQATGRTYCPKH